MLERESTQYKLHFPGVYGGGRLVFKECIVDHLKGFTYLIIDTNVGWCALRLQLGSSGLQDVQINMSDFLINRHNLHREVSVFPPQATCKCGDRVKVLCSYKAES